MKRCLSRMMLWMKERNINEKISDPANWENMNQNLRDLIVMKDPVRDNDLFKNDGVQTQLAHDGANDWKNIENNLAFRGDNEEIYQENSGIFSSLIQMIVEFDPNELILMLAGEIKKIIIEKLKESKYFFVIIDCTPDLSHEEQMSIVLRCVDISTSPVKGLFDELVNALNNLEININNIRGQGYDSGANMKRKHKGVQNRLLEVNPRAFYTPYNVNGLALNPLSQTRWESHVESIRAIRFQAPQIINALLEVARVDDPKTKSEAKCLATYEIENFEFLLRIVIWYEVLNNVNRVSKHLQTKDIHIDIAIDHLKRLISFFKSYRESRFESIVIDVKETTSKLDIEPIFREKRVIRRKK
ncbi:zinc finger MYM-type protein 1-like [Olea europaea var. sylvestris]|uniref:zinc finger MYM-type protein 1-like n=1 Tax=Olea europaea var. sylvestris TaxID=158386 RepID=UPI000C1D5F53|nr:zinc finger MYM-type protein 1-like [Olea europaea var. sylvestris]